jgi:hypothetical protein
MAGAFPSAAWHAHGAQLEPQRITDQDWIAAAGGRLQVGPGEGSGSQGD